MTPEEIIKEVQENASEWLEMSHDPATIVAGILANKIIKLEDHIEYLERKILYTQRLEIGRKKEQCLCKQIWKYLPNIRKGQMNG